MRSQVLFLVHGKAWCACNRIFNLFPLVPTPIPFPHTQFNFLKPTHSMFTFFTSLCDAYSRVMMPEKSLKEKLAKDASDR